MPNHILHQMADQLVSKESLVYAIELRLEMWANSAVQDARVMGDSVRIYFPPKHFFKPIYELLTAMDMYDEAISLEAKFQAICDKIGDGPTKHISNMDIPHVDDPQMA